MAIKFLNTVQVDTDVLYVDAANNRVGIGTTSPSTVLEVSSSGVNGVDISQSASNASQSGRLFFTTNTASEGFALFNSNGTFQVNSGGIPNNTSGTNRISIIGSSGNVGIGTTSPSAKLDIYGGLRLGTTSDFNITQSPFSATVFYIQGGGNGGLITFGAPSSNQQNVSVQGDLSTYVGSTSGYLGTKAFGSFNNRLNPSGDNYLNSGKLGIGITSPNAKLDVVQSTAANGEPALHLIGPNTNPGLTSSVLIIEQGDGKKITIDGNDIDVSSGDLFINDYSKKDVTFGGQIKVTGGGVGGDSYFANGNVGIGTTSPSELLHLKSTGPARILIEADTDNVTETDNAQIILKQDGGAVVGNLGFKTGTNGIEITNQYVGADGILTFGTRGVERMRISDLGNVGIGTTSPSTKLHVFGTTASLPALGAAPSAAQIGGSSYGTLFSTLTSGTGVIQQGRSDGNSPYTFPLLINPNGGNVGIGATSSSSKLYIQGSTSTTSSQLMRIISTTSFSTTPGRMIEFIRSNNTVRGYISMNSYGVQYNTSSDYRLKENITPINDALDRLKKLKPSRFSWKEEPSDYKVDGFIAHEVAEVIPEAISGEKDAVDENNKPSYQGIDQAKIVPLLTAALQEAISKIEQLETRIQTLENK